MILEKIKKLIKTKLNTKHSFVFHGSRNQTEEFDGVILRMYPAVFLVELIDGQKRAYSYNDVLIGNLEIID